MKDECSGTAISEYMYIGLRSKLHSVVRADEPVIIKAKCTKNMLSKSKYTLKNTKTHYTVKNNVHTK